jgi:hypothetical protein
MLTAAEIPIVIGDHDADASDGLSPWQVGM